MKKLVTGLLATAATLVVLPMFAAFEAHVINVTAKIENALSVNTTPIDFGTVFPQEELNRQIDIVLSESFQDESDANDVEYILRQKPKCAWTTDVGTVLLDLPTKSGHVDEQGNITCPEPDTEIDNGATWGPLPLLCRYLSKHDLDPDDQNDDAGLDAFHEIGSIDPTLGWVWNDVHGKLEKDNSGTADIETDFDLRDLWNLDLKVPCFGNHCAQDWEAFVTEINGTANPDNFVQSIENEHKIFGCDLWIEVTGVSRFSTSTPQ